MPFRKLRLICIRIFLSAQGKPCFLLCERFFRLIQLTWFQTCRWYSPNLLQCCPVGQKVLLPRKGDFFLLSLRSRLFPCRCREKLREFAESVFKKDIIDPVRAVLFEIYPMKSLWCHPSQLSFLERDRSRWLQNTVPFLLSLSILSGLNAATYMASLLQTANRLVPSIVKVYFD